MKHPGHDEDTIIPLARRRRRARLGETTPSLASSSVPMKLGYVRPLLNAPKPRPLVFVVWRSDNALIMRAPFGPPTV